MVVVVVSLQQCWPNHCRLVVGGGGGGGVFAAVLA